MRRSPDNGQQIVQRKHFGSVSEATGLQIWRHVDPILGPRKIPRVNEHKEGKVVLENGTFTVDVQKNEIYLDAVEAGKVNIGTSFIYLVE